jgi:hypothetical protein
MKTKLMIEIETDDKLEVYMEEGQTEEDFKTKEQKKELKEFQNDFRKGLHKYLVNLAKRPFEDGGAGFEEEFFDEPDEYLIDDYESFNDYGIKIKVTEVK